MATGAADEGSREQTGEGDLGNFQSRVEGHTGHTGGGNDQQKGKKSSNHERKVMNNSRWFLTVPAPPADGLVAPFIAADFPRREGVLGVEHLHISRGEA